MVKKGYPRRAQVCWLFSCCTKPTTRYSIGLGDIPHCLNFGWTWELPQCKTRVLWYNSPSTIIKTIVDQKDPHPYCVWGVLLKGGFFKDFFKDFLRIFFLFLDIIIYFNNLTNAMMKNFRVLAHFPSVQFILCLFVDQSHCTDFIIIIYYYYYFVLFLFITLPKNFIKRKHPSKGD
jgi:hypothetical protein